MKIRIIEIFGVDYGDYDYTDRVYHTGDMTDWEEVTEEELEALTLWAREENSKNYDKKISIVTEKMVDLKPTISVYLEKARLAKEKLLEQQKRKAEAEERKKAKQKKLKEKKLEKSREKKLILLNELKAELGVV